MAEWLTIEVFDEAHAAWLWRDRHGDVLVAAALTCGATYWEWHEHPYGVVLEVALPDDAAVERLPTLPSVRAALEMAPDPQTGVLVYRGRGGGAGARVPSHPCPPLAAGAAELPVPADELPLLDEPLRLLITTT